MLSQVWRILHSFVTGSDAPKVGLHLAYTFVNGWLNGLTLRRYKAFSTMMVGNTMLLMAAVSCNPDDIKGRERECPASYGKGHFYAALIISFCVGASVAHVFCRRCEWPTRAFAPLFICVTLFVEGADMLNTDQSMFVIPVVLACLYGMSAHLTLKGGLGSLPWCTTGNVIAICFHGVTLVLDPNEDDGKKLLSNTLLWVFFASGVALGTKFSQEGYLLLCTCLLAGLLAINDQVFMKREDTAVDPAAGAGQQDAGPVSQSSSDRSVSVMPSVTSQTSMGSVADTYAAARESFDTTPYLSTSSHRRSLREFQHQLSVGMQRQASPGSHLPQICEGSETFLELGAVRGT